MKLYPQQIHQDKEGFCKKSGSKVQESDGNFTLGTDGLLHYTETHHDIFHHNQNKTGSQEFCIEATEDQGYLLMGIENLLGVKVRSCYCVSILSNQAAKNFFITSKENKRNHQKLQFTSKEAVLKFKK